MDRQQPSVRRVLALVLVASAALFAVGSHIERSKEGAAAAPRPAGASGVRTAESGVQRTAEAGGDARVPAAPKQMGAASGETRSGNDRPAETGIGGSEAAPTAPAEPSTGETTGQLKRESRVASGDVSGTASRENPTERLREKHREAKLLGVNPEALSLVIVAVVASVLLAVGIWFRRLAAVLVLIAGFGVAFAALDVREVLHQVDESRTNLIIIASVLIGLHLLVSILAGATLFSTRTRSRPTVG